MAGRVHCAAQDAGQGRAPPGARVGDPQNGIHLRIIPQAADFHDIGGVDDYDNLLKIGLGMSQQITFLLVQLQLMLSFPIVGRLGNRGGHGLIRVVDIRQQIGREVHAFAALPSENHDGCIPVVGIRTDNLVSKVTLGELADVVGLFFGFIHSAGWIGHRNLVQAALIHGQHCGVYLEAGGCECVSDAHALVRIAGAGSRSAEDRLHTPAAQQGNILLCSSVQGQCAALVLQ